MKSLSTPASASVLQGMRVLLFEDDPDLREALRQALQIEGFEASAFAAVEDCTERMTTAFRGVVITDIRLPGADGRQLFRRLHEIDPEIPVILITGHGDLQEAVDLMREGAYDFISKPFRVRELLARVKAHLRTGRELNQARAEARSRILAAMPGATAVTGRSGS